MTRWIIEGTWSGYTSAQERVCHRKVTNRERIARAAEALGAIAFTDGTRLYIAVREAKPREKVAEIDGYSSLIADCIRHNVRSVSALPKEPQR